MYSAQVLDHFQNPRNAGEMPEADAHARIENPACGDTLELFACVRSGRIEQLRFRAKGCVPAMACGSLITEIAKGRSLDDAKNISKEEVVAAIGGLPAASGHAAQLAVDTLRATLQKLKTSP